MTKKITFALVIIFTFCHFSYGQTTTFPKNDIADERQGLYAFVNANIVIDAKNVLINGTLLIKGAYIQSVGANIVIPKDAIVIDCKGKSIYPSFIDAESDYGMPEVKRGGGGFFSGEMESKKKGAYAWNQAIQPENDASTMFTANAKMAEEMRKIGFGAVVTHHHDGIARGTSALVALIDGKEQNAILKSKVSANYSFLKGSSPQSYPNSMMGSVALLRQTYLDADWYKKAKNKTEFNISLDAFNQNQNIPQVFETVNRSGVLRADKIGDEFGVQYIILAGGDEYQRVNEIKSSGASLIVPLNFPQAYDVEDAFDAKGTTLAQMKHWELAPTNAKALANAAVSFAFTANANKNKADFWTNVQKSIEYGLSEETALSALTTTPAAILKIDDIVGSLKSGLLANFLISSGNIFKKENVIYENWVKGKKYLLTEMNIADIRGNYLMNVGDQKMKLNITGKATSPEYQIIVRDSVKITPKVTRVNDLFSINFAPDTKKSDLIRLNGYLENGLIKGTGQLADGSAVNFNTSISQAFKETKAAADTSLVKTPEIGKVIYPFVAFGNNDKPISETLLFKNTTVWTNETEGNISGTDVLVENGKIAKIGKNLESAKAKVINGEGKYLTNGIIDEHSHIGLFAINEGGQTVTAEVREADVINVDDINIYRQLGGGVTTSQLLHGSANSIGGQSAIIKLKWGEDANGFLVKNASPFIKFALGENVTRKGSQGFGGNANPRYPISRMGVEQVMMDAFTKAKAYDESWKTFNSLNAKDKAIAIAPRKDLELEAIAEILNKKRFITCHSYVQSEINMLMKVADQFNFKVNTFTHILEGYKVAEKMASHGVAASTFSDWWAYKMEVRDAIPYNAAIMTKKGVTVAINSDDAEMARRLNQEAAKTMLYGGMTEQEAWKMVTLNPAKMLHLDDRLGSIKVGKDADLVLWNNNPLSVYARPEKTIIDGAIYFDLEKEAQKQAENTKERARLIQKMISKKAGGAPTQKAKAEKQHIAHCDDEMSGF